MRTRRQSATVYAGGGTRRQALLFRASFESGAIVPGEPQTTAPTGLTGPLPLGAQPGQEAARRLAGSW